MNKFQKGLWVSPCGKGRGGTSGPHVVSGRVTRAGEVSPCCEEKGSEEVGEVVSN